MKRLVASKAGFVFLVVSLGLVILLVSTIRYKSNLALFHPVDRAVVLHANSASVGITMTMASGAQGTKIDFAITPLRKWLWELALAPHCSLQTTFDFYASCFVPIWMLLLPSAFASLYYYRRARRNRLIGHCRKCEYDLTGNTSGVCPECGAAVVDTFKS